MDEAKRVELALKYAWDWFNYHAAQRLTAFRAYLIILGVIALGYARFLEIGTTPARVIGAFGALISVAFLLLDIRNTELVNCGRVALDTIEAEIGSAIREDDRKRRQLYGALGWLSQRLLRPLGVRENEPIPGILRELTLHQFWLRTILFLLFLAFLSAALWPGPQAIQTQSGRPGEQTRRQLAEGLLLRMRTVERKLREIILIKKIAGKGSPELAVTGQVSALLVLAKEPMDECPGAPTIKQFCAEYQTWYQKTTQTFDAVIKARPCKIIQALGAIPDEGLRELEIQLGTITRLLG